MHLPNSVPLSEGAHCVLTSPTEKYRVKLGRTKSSSSCVEFVEEWSPIHQDVSVRRRKENPRPRLRLPPPQGRLLCLQEFLLGSLTTPT